MKIEIHDEALMDLVEGFRFYERQLENLGFYFLDSLFSDIDSLKLNAGTHASFFGHHRMLTKRFPFAVYYRIEEGTVRIYAIAAETLLGLKGN